MHFQRNTIPESPFIPGIAEPRVLKEEGARTD